MLVILYFQVGWFLCMWCLIFDMFTAWGSYNVPLLVVLYNGITTVSGVCEAIVYLLSYKHQNNHTLVVPVCISVNIRFEAIAETLSDETNHTIITTFREFYLSNKLPRKQLFTL